MYREVYVRETAESVKNKIMCEIGKIRSDKLLMSRIYLITLATSLLVLAVAVRGPEQKGKIISDSEGNAILIERHSVKTSENYDLELAIKEAGEVMTKEIKLSLQAIRKDDGGMGLTEEPSREDLLDAAIDSAISEIEYSRNEKIRLPDHLSDGTAISWKALYKKDYSLMILIPAIYIALLVFVIRYSGEKKSAIDEMRRRSILRGLPRFCNQLFLMMNAGMILSDAFEHITNSYAKSSYGEDEGENSYFMKELASLRAKDPEYRKSSASIINEFAVQNDVKEMIRIAAILTENEKRGSDVIESLSRESRYLWDERKIVARESGKMIDTKMAYPLGILLILLIVITMAPAMLSM